MRYLHIIFIVFGLMISTLSNAGQVEYDNCILKNLKGAKLDLATNFIKQACKENFKNSSFISKNRKKYNNCLLENLIGIESMQAVLAIKSACESQYK